MSIPLISRPAGKMSLHLERATWRDWDILVKLRRDAEEWLRSRGSQQWCDHARGLDQMSRHLDQDEMYLVCAHPQAIVGCVVLSLNPDRDFWPDATYGEWLYLSKAITARWAVHSGVGEFMTAEALSEARERGCQGVRLDVWRGPDGAGARRRWEQLGFSPVGECIVPGRWSGARYEQHVPAESEAENAG